MSEGRVFLVLDANVLAGYYAPQTLRPSGRPAVPRITEIVESVRKRCSPNLRLLVPEICVAETQTVLSKHANPKWKGGGNKKQDQQAIHLKAYKGMVKKMRDDLHGGNVIESIPLQRYHVLAKHLITPIDHHSHIKKPDGTGATNELGGTDQLVCGLSIWLARLMGQDRVAVLTVDYRLNKILERARKVTDTQAAKWGLLDRADDIGCEWSREIYPMSFHLAKASEKSLRTFLGCWPLPTKLKNPLKHKRAPRKADVESLLKLYQAMGIGRDRLPYSNEMKKLSEQFSKATGNSLSEGEVWRLLIDRLKKGGGKVRK